MRRRRRERGGVEERGDPVRVIITVGNQKANVASSAPTAAATLQKSPRYPKMQQRNEGRTQKHWRKKVCN